MRMRTSNIVAIRNNISLIRLPFQIICERENETESV